MKRNYRKIFAALFAVLLLAGAGVAGGAWYLLDYALKPGDRSRNEARAWQEMDSLYPGLQAWHDSLVRVGAWRDTTILADDGAKLHAYYVPAARPVRRTAVLVHGYTDCAVRMMHLGRMYAREMGTNILVPDLRNAGQTDGDHFQMGWLDRLDVKRWLRLVPELFGDSAAVVVHGVSMGAATTMMLSGDADVPAAVVAYVEDCGYTSADEQFSKELEEQFGLPRWPLIPAASALCRLRYGWSFEDASALTQVSKCSRPMLFIHGTADRFVPTEMVHPLYAAHLGPKRLWLVTGAVHARSYRHSPGEYARRVRAFLSEFGGAAFAPLAADTARLAADTLSRAAN